MNKIYLLLLAAIIMSSCADYLDEKTFTDVTNKYLVTSPSGMAATIVGLYSVERDLLDGGETDMWNNLNMGDDITWARAGGGVPQFSRYENMTPTTSTVGSFWKLQYKIIGYANMVIDAQKNVDMKDPIAIQAVAEAKMFRAHAYFSLIRRYDNILLTTKVTTPENLNDPKEYKHANPDDVYALINADIDEAMKSLPLSTPQLGRYTKGTARHIKAKVAMWQGNWQVAANQIDSIDVSGVYGLMPVGDVFTGGSQNHTEALHVFQWNRGAGGWLPPSTGTVGKGHRMPLWYTPLYNNEMGMKITFEEGAYPWGRLFPNNYLLGLYDKKKDKRYNAWYRHYWTYNDPDADLPRGKNLGDTIFPATQGQYQNLHPMILKYEDSWTRTTPNEMTSFKDVMVYRLAGSYLIGAEAYFRLGDMTKAVAYYNKTWVRAGNTAVSSITMEDIIEEHARELAMENGRWYFLKRNNILIERVKLYGGEDIPLNTDLRARDNIQPFHVRLPIPQNQIDIMGPANFPQNDDY